MNERTACAPFPEDEISTEDNCIPRPRANVQFVVSARSPLLNARNHVHIAHIYFRTKQVRSATVMLCYAHEHRHHTVAAIPVPWSASASEIYASLCACLDIRHVQTCPTSVEQPPRSPKLPRSVRPVAEVRLHFDRGLARIWHRPYHPRKDIPRCG